MKKPKKLRNIIALGGLTLWSAAMIGCGSNSDNPTLVSPGSSASFRVIEPGPISNAKGSVDTLEMEAFDANGARVAGPTEVAFSTITDFPALPPTATRVELDYLRNGGFPLFRANLSVSNSGTVRSQTTDDGVVVNGIANNPAEKAVSDPETAWTIDNDGAGNFRLKLTLTDETGEVTTQPDFRIKGICYSPSPINVVGDGAPNIGDFFIDNVFHLEDPNDPNSEKIIDFYNYFALWGTKTFLYSFQCEALFSRGDIDKIRGLGANSIRVYSFLSRHQGDPRQNQPQYPIDFANTYHYQHTAFLDECYNNGKNPIYVMVGIPTPSEIWYLDQFNTNDQALQDKITLYLKNLEEVVQDVGNHPAVLGFCLVNELNDGQNAYPGSGTNGVMPANQPNLATTNAKSDFYWGRMKAYSDQTKTNAPGKLVGAAFHDFPEIGQYASAVPNPGPTYLEQLSNLDFVGVNTYHTESYDHVFERGWLNIAPDKRKPLIWTEFGFSATRRDNPQPGDIAGLNPEEVRKVLLQGFGEDTMSRQKTADLVKRQLPRVHNNEGVLGMYYFEYSDEWWKQKDQDYRTEPNPFDPGNTINVPRADVWCGGPFDGGFPNGSHDQEGFGLFSARRYGNLSNDANVINPIGIDGRVDILTERTEITGVLKDFWATLLPRS